MVRGQSQYAWSTSGKDAAPSSSTGSNLDDAAMTRKSVDDSAPCLAMVDSQGFDICMATIVLVNVALLSIETDTQGSQGLWKRINEGFLLCYLLELVLRFLRHGSAALRDRLTALDAVLVVLAFVDRVASERSLARALPVLRLVRAFRLLTSFSFFRNARELHVLVENSGKALTTLMWVVLILFVVLWSCAAWTKVAIGESPAWAGSMDPLVPHEPFSSFDSHEYFGSVPRSLLTLLQLTTLSQWADNVARPVFRVYPAALFFFVFFLFAVTYGVLMCIVSIIVEDAISASRRVETAMQEAERQDREAIGRRAFKIFSLTDFNSDGELSVPEMEYALKTTDLDRVLKDLDVPVLDAQSLVYLFDKDGDGSVSLEEFVTGIVAMSDDMNPRDFAKLSIWVEKLMMRAVVLQAKLERLQEQLIALKQKLEIGFTAIDRFLNSQEDTDLRRRAIKAIQSAPPDLPPAPVLKLPAEAENEPQVRSNAFAKLSMPMTSAWASAFAKKHRAKIRWVTVASPFVTVRDQPHITGNHIAALRPGELVELEELSGDEPVSPERIPEYGYLRCWKLDKQGARTISGFVVPYTPAHGAHFAPSTEDGASAGRSPPEAQDMPVGDTVMAPVVTVATPPRLPSPEGEDRTLATLVNQKAVLPPAPPPFHIAKREADLLARKDDKYGPPEGIRGVAPNPNLSQLKELLS